MFSDDNPKNSSLNSEEWDLLSTSSDAWDMVTRAQDWMTKTINVRIDPNTTPRQKSYREAVEGSASIESLVAMTQSRDLAGNVSPVDILEETNPRRSFPYGKFVEDIVCIHNSMESKERQKEFFENYKKILLQDPVRYRTLLTVAGGDKSEKNETGFGENGMLKFTKLYYAPNDPKKEKTLPQAVRSIAMMHQRWEVLNLAESGEKVQNEMQKDLCSKLIKHIPSIHMQNDSLKLFGEFCRLANLMTNNFYRNEVLNSLSAEADHLPLQDKPQALNALLDAVGDIRDAREQPYHLNAYLGIIFKTNKLEPTDKHEEAWDKAFAKIGEGFLEIPRDKDPEFWDQSRGQSLQALALGALKLKDSARFEKVKDLVPKLQFQVNREKLQEEFEFYESLFHVKGKRLDALGQEAFPDSEQRMTIPSPKNTSRQRGIGD